jgi:hypothetical protein
MQTMKYFFSFVIFMFLFLWVIYLSKPITPDKILVGILIWLLTNIINWFSLSIILGRKKDDD